MLSSYASFSVCTASYPWCTGGDTFALHIQFSVRGQNFFLTPIFPKWLGMLQNCFRGLVNGDSRGSKSTADLPGLRFMAWDQSPEMTKKLFFDPDIFGHGTFIRLSEVGDCQHSKFWTHKCFRSKNRGSEFWEAWHFGDIPYMWLPITGSRYDSLWAAKSVTHWEWNCFQCRVIRVWTVRVWPDYRKTRLIPVHDRTCPRYPHIWGKWNAVYPES